MAPPKKRQGNAVSTQAATGLLAEMQAIATSMGIEDSPDFTPVPTGLSVLDYHNGRYFLDPVTESYIPYLGIPSGKMIGFIGYTGTGKTTLAVQAAHGIIHEFIGEGSHIFHFDLENAWSKARTCDITGMDLKTCDKAYTRIPPRSAETIYEFVKKLINLRKEAIAKRPDEILYTDPSGRLVPKPLVVIIDTVAALQTEKVLNENEAIGSMMFEKGQQAGMNNLIAQRLAGMIGEVNITLMWVNHIREKIQDGPVRSAKPVQYLGANETVPGGTGFPQYTDYYLKLQPTESLDNDEGFKVLGKIVRGTILKSRLSYDGRQFELVLTDTGFDNTLSNLNFLRRNKVLKGGGIGYFLEATDDSGKVIQSRKFSLAKFRDFYREDPEFRSFVDTVMQNELWALLPQPNSSAEQNIIDGAVHVVGDPLQIADPTAYEEV